FRFSRPPRSRSKEQAAKRPLDLSSPCPWNLDIHAPKFLLAIFRSLAIELKRIIDHIASWLVALKERKEKVHQDTDTFMKRGKNGLVVGIVIFGTFFTFFAYNLYRDYGEWWL